MQTSLSFSAQYCSVVSNNVYFSDEVTLNKQKLSWLDDLGVQHTKIHSHQVGLARRHSKYFGICLSDKLLCC